MNIQTEQLDQSIYNFIKQVMPMTQVNGNNALAPQMEQQDGLTYAKQILDQYFPLSQGSHQDVCSYVIYYKQLLAFFADGSQSGLAQPRQFVALSGHKCEPSSLVLKNNGFHIEIALDRRGEQGRHDLAGINDVQVEAALMTIVDNEQSPCLRTWTSLVTGQADQHCKEFTSKDGTEYRL
ncbi:malate synthase [Shewanella insulae]|uniref:Malate synthase n=1 Tax=Shewanella insulae TaxID=2681496 RepID=A0A6L7HVV7_9GAMM|nr:malate synthase [Shewanella insulae]MCG9713713.1 malate synthase [Shewanella insulae]MXR68355.1 malate synthase [Shewanella insulae]